MSWHRSKMILHLPCVNRKELWPCRWSSQPRPPTVALSLVPSSPSFGLTWSTGNAARTFRRLGRSCPAEWAASSRIPRFRIPAFSSGICPCSVAPILARDQRTSLDQLEATSSNRPPSRTLGPPCLCLSSCHDASSFSVGFERITKRTESFVN